MGINIVPFGALPCASSMLSPIQICCNGSIIMNIISLHEFFFLVISFMNLCPQGILAVFFLEILRMKGRDACTPSLMMMDVRGVGGWFGGKIG